MLEPKYYVLSELLERRLFKIPDYQRAYSWETRQRSDLFEDIGKLSNASKDRHHFMASIVCHESGQDEIVGAEEFKIIDVVDGQQRLTSLIILLKAIEKELSSKIELEKDLRNDISSLLRKRDDSLILLQTNHDARGIFSTYITDGKISELTDLNLSETNLVNGIRESERFVKKWKSQNGDLISLLRILKNKIGFVFYVLSDAGSVYTIFEVLNSRGLEVDWLDKCKSSFMGIIHEKYKPKTAKIHQNSLHSTWCEIYKVLGNRIVPGHEVMRFAATLSQKGSPSRLLGAERSLDFFKEQCEKDPKKTISYSNFFLEIAQSLNRLYSNPSIEAVTDISQARLLAIAIENCSLFDRKVKEKLLEKWEKITFKIFGLYGKDARTCVGDYVRAANRIFNKKLKTRSDAMKELEEIGARFPIERAIEELRGSDCYTNWESSLRYFFYRYEEYLCSIKKVKLPSDVWQKIWSASPVTSIEHIFPQTPSKSWTGKMGKGRDVIENNVHRLGNIILLPPGINSEARNKPFQEKKKVYRKHPLYMNEAVLKCKDWKKANIERREKELLEWAKNNWG